MMHQVMINAFGNCHTRSIGAAQHVHRVQNFGKIGPKNILKNILKTTKIHPCSDMLNTLFQFVHMSEGAKVTTT